jgi:acetylornithine deacetylase
MKFLNDLLANTHNGDYSKITSIIKKHFESFNDCKIIIQKISELKNNIIIIWGTPNLVVNVHLDTVAPSSLWSLNPYELNRRDNLLFGLGVCDTKSNIYAIFKAINKVRPKNMMILFSIDEESNSIESGVTYFLNSTYAKNIKRAIICEPTNNELGFAHKGYYSFMLTTRTLSRHSSNVEFLSDNAIVKMSKLLKKLYENEFNIGKIQGGVSGNIIAPECNLQISKRTFETFKTTYDLLINLINHKAKIEVKAILPPLKPNSFDFNFDGNYLNFWTEAALFSQKGINSLVYGIGDIKQAHTEDEFITIESLQKGIDFFTNLINSENENDTGLFKIF